METTINIHTATLKKISEAAGMRGISRTEMINALLKQMMIKHSTAVQMGRLVQYQGKGTPGEWHRFHIVFRVDDYEYFLDLRKLLKMSLSLILAYAVKKYIRDVLNTNFTDNNRFVNYVIIMETIDSIIYWKLCWGYPPGIGDII